MYTKQKHITCKLLRPSILPLLTLVYLINLCVVHTNHSLGHSKSAISLLPVNHQCQVSCLSSSHDPLTLPTLAQLHLYFQGEDVALV